MSLQLLKVSQKENKRFHLDVKIMRANPVKVNIFQSLKKQWFRILTLEQNGNLIIDAETFILLSILINTFLFNRSVIFTYWSKSMCLEFLFERLGISS